MSMRFHGRALACGVLGVLVLATTASTDDTLTLERAALLREVREAVISPSGEHTAYVVSVPRRPYEDEDGPAWQELHVAGPEAGRTRPFVSGEVSVSELGWTPEGRAIAFLAKRCGDEARSLYVIPVDGGEARKLVEHAEDLEAYAFSPDGRQVAFSAREQRTERRKRLEEQGFRAQVYEEDLRPKRLWMAPLGEDGHVGEARMLALEGSVSQPHWSPRGDKLVLALAPTPLVDHHYMQRKLCVVDAASGRIEARIENPGKLGQVVWSPDGSRVAALAAAELHDPKETRLLVAPAAGGEPIFLFGDWEGDIVSIAFRDAETLVYVGHQGVETLLGSVRLDGSGRRTLVPAGGPALRSVTLDASGRRAALVADAPGHPRELFLLSRGEAAPVRVTDSNPWLAEVSLAPQEVVRYRARDGLELEGLLLRPLHEEGRHPLLVMVHGGPEAHHSNGWLPSYSRPGQTAAASGYAVFYPNYRGSTGRGVAFSRLSQADYAGGEFDDLVDGIEHLVETGLVDRKRVGITGRSYGGFAAAWGATALSEHFASAVMGVGVSDHISKYGTTDIPDEMLQVHARREPWKHWDWFRERSPLYHVEQARTPILIMTNLGDTRVHPSQSLELYRYLKTLGRVPVRLVLYPDEKHGSRHAAARLDYGLRLLRWMDHYLLGPGGEPPPYDLEHAAAESEDQEGQAPAEPRP